MNGPTGAEPAHLPDLPLLLHRTPPALQTLLIQEGIAFRILGEASADTVWRQGRFLLFDSHQVSRSAVERRLRPGQVAVDVGVLRASEVADPYAALLETRPSYRSWTVAGRLLTERVTPIERGQLRRRMLEQLRRLVTGAGGIWARLAPFPAGYRSAFAFRVDLDEPVPQDYFGFARAREPIADCTTHFVSTAAYGHDRAVLADLRGHDTQSHGHHHVVVADPDLNRRNLLRARRMLRQAGFDPVGFVAPEGRWNPGLDRAIEAAGHHYSSDFQLGYDDFPFFPWREEAFSPVLQVPVHPICEGLFVEAGLDDPDLIADYLAGVVRDRIAAGEPAFVYGHPERRLGRMPQVPRRLGQVLSQEPGVWRTTLTEFAAWWRYRMAQQWSLTADGPPGQLNLSLAHTPAGLPLALEVFRGDEVATVRLGSPVAAIPWASLQFQNRPQVPDRPGPVPAQRRTTVRALARAALDWETVVPIDELPGGTLPARLKRGLRRWRDRSRSRLEVIR